LGLNIEKRINMKKLTIAFLLLTLSALTSWAGDFQKGMSAYVSGDYTTAFKEFAASAEQGNVDAQSILGYMYNNGQGVPQDYKQAAKWYTKAAEQGYADAQSNLALSYANGQGVPQDNVYAHMWFNLAAANGSETASKNRDIIAKRMTTADISKAQSLARECLKKNYKGC
jgi:uncharacterized protein